MSSYVHSNASADNAKTIEHRPDRDAGRRESSASAVRTWAWARTSGVYDWMDAHTPCDDLDSWR
jgi:hypothetical protein